MGFQGTMNREARPYGQLHSVRWRVTSIVKRQILDRAITCCSLLHLWYTLGRKNRMKAALRKARMTRMWRDVNLTLSREANNPGEAAETVNIVLVRAGNGRGRIFDSGVRTRSLLQRSWQASNMYPRVHR